MVWLCGVATGLLVGPPAMCVGYQPAAVDEIVAVDNSDTVNDQSALSHSAVPLRDRTLQEHLRRARTMIEQREFAPAVAALREGASRDSNVMILTAETPGSRQQFHGSHAVIEELLRSLPNDALSIHLNQAEPLARSRFLLAVRESNFEALRQLALQFPLTTAARDALHTLVARHLDRREFAAADAVARRLARHPNLSATQREAILQTIDLSAAYSTEQRTASQRTTSQLPRSVPEEALPGPTASRAQLMVDDADSVPTLLAKLFPDLGSPDWQVHSGLDDETTTLARHALHEHFEQSIPILPRAQPLVVGEVVLRRSLTDVSAHDLESGRLLWSEESESEAGQSASRLTMNLSLQELMAQKLARGLQIDSLQSRLSSDGERVFTVETGGTGGMSGYVPARTGLSSGSSFGSRAQNRIVARQLRTGKVLWNVTAESILAADSSRENSQAPRNKAIKNDRPGNATSENEARLDFHSKVAASDVYFCGLPTLVDRCVFGLVQVADSLRMYAADRNTGRIDWSLDVAEAARHSPADIDWRSLDCRVTLIDGVLVCPTGAGLLVGVDLATRSVIWSRRYARADVPLEVTRLPFAPARPQRPWWLGWRDNTLLRVAGFIPESSGGDAAAQLATSILIAASPDAEGINAVDPRTGQRLWTHSLESPVDLISDEDRIIVVARHFVSALKAHSGEVIWKVPCREPVGTGYMIRLPAESGQKTAAPYYLFPARGGSLVAVNCDDGAIIESVDRLESMSGCLISADDRLIMLNPDRLSTWTMLSAVSDRRPTDAATLQTPVKKNSIDRAIDLAVLERSTGQFDAAAARLKGLVAIPESSHVKREHAKTLLAWINSGTLPPQRVQEVESEAAEVVGRSSIAELIELRHAAARAAFVSGDSVLALKFYAKLQSLNPSGEPRFLKPEPLRSVRHDRLIQGEVLDLLNGADEAVAKRLAHSMTELAETASKSRDPFALQRFTRQWQHLPVAAEYSLDERSGIGLRFGQKQLSLLALADSADSEVALQASRNLIQLYESRSYHRDAAAIRTKVLRQGFDKELTPEGRAAGSPWNAGEVTVSEHAEQNLDTSFIPVPVECSTGSLFDRLNVEINPRSSRNDTILRFYGDGFSGSWQTVLATSSSPLKSVGRMYRGWGIGHFLVLQLGAELFGISPFDGSGEPRVQRLWSVDMADGNRQEDHEYAVAVPGFFEEHLTMLDAFGRPIAKVGPVRAGYLCFQTRGKLVCLDTSTGQRLWQRYELPRQAICSGDGNSVFLTEPGRDRVTVLRAVDGAMVSQFSLSEVVGFQGAVLQGTGNRVLVAERSADSAQTSDTLRISRIAAINLQSASVEWDTDNAPESTVFAIGSDWLGVLSLPGQLRIVSATTGLEISALEVQRPDVVRAIHVSSDSSTHLIAMSNVAESEYLNGRGDGNRSRNPSVTGQLVAVDSQTAELKWQRPVERIRFLIDQPKNAPCLALVYRRSRSSGTEATEPVLHVIHRETGEDILMRQGASSASNFTFEPHADQNRLSIRMARKSIRLTFAPAVAP
jgi:outer membrane protein assembly factor BamB